MGRLLRFGESRFVGVRDEMVVYDCDDEVQFAIIQSREENESLTASNLLSAISPDTLAEARNRGYRPFNP